MKVRSNKKEEIKQGDAELKRDYEIVPKEEVQENG